VDSEEGATPGASPGQAQSYIDYNPGGKPRGKGDFNRKYWTKAPEESWTSGTKRDCFLIKRF